MTGFPYRLYLVIGPDCCTGRDWLHVATEAIAGGVDLIQLRDKTAPDAAFHDEALHLKAIADRAGIPLIVNDRVSVARDIGAVGVHVGNTDQQPVAIRAAWPACGILGYSIEYPAQLASAETAAADYLGISPVFRTDTKTDTVTEWGLEGIAQIRALTEKPLVAIGNMNSVNAGSVIRAGADCLAVVSAICAAKDPRRAAATLRNIIERSL